MPPRGCSPSCTPAAICAPTAGTSSVASSCTAGWRTNDRPHGAAAGAAGGLRTAQASRRGPAHAPPIRIRGAVSRAGVRARHRVLRGLDRARRRRRRRRNRRRRTGPHPQTVGHRDGPPRHQAGQPPRPRRSPVADRRGVRRGPPSPWRQAVDLANVMLCLALRCDPDASINGRDASSPSTRSARRSPPPTVSPFPPSSGATSASRAATCMASSSPCVPPDHPRSESNAGVHVASAFIAAMIPPRSSSPYRPD